MCNESWCIKGEMVLLITSVILILFLPLIKPQGDSQIIGITSYNLCFNVVPNANSTNSEPYLNCTEPGNPQGLPITTIQLSLVASGTSNSAFEVNLTTVPTEGANRANKNGERCDADGGSFENCVVTTPAVMQIESTSYVYYYNLRQSSLVVPQYCYVAKFNAETTKDVSVETGGKTFGNNLGLSGTITCYQNTNVQYCQGSGEEECNEMIDFYGEPANIAYNNLNQSGPYPNQYYKMANQNSSSDIIKNDPSTAAGTCRDTMFSFDSIRKGPKPSLCDRHSIDSFSTIVHDDYPTLSSFPISDPIPQGLASKVNSAYGNVLQTTSCGGFNCGGIYSAICYENFTNTSAEVNAPGFCAYNALSGGIGSKGNAGTIGMGLDIFSLGPECLLYEIDETPGVLVTVRVKITTNGTGDTDDGIDDVQEFLITNVMGGQQVSSPQLVAGARVINVDTLDGYIGPSLAGYIVMCGEPDISGRGQPYESAFVDYSDPRERVLRESERSPPTTKNEARIHASILDPDSLGLRNFDFIDMDSYVFNSSDQYDPVRNPWDVIQEGLPGKSGYYPTGENLNYSPIDKPPRNAMWYYIPIEQQSWIGKGCNQIGLTDLFWNTNFQGGEPNSVTGVEQCYLSPFMCVPGYSDESYGGRSIPGCLASAAFKASEEGNSEQFQYNQDQINYVLQNSLPFGYNPQQPNYWTTALEGVGQALVFDASKSKSPGAQPPLSFDVLIDFVGSFVAYESIVPNGVIINITCSNGTEGDFNVGNVTIQNRGTIAGSFIVQIECPVDSGIDIDPSTIDYPLVEPGDFAEGEFFYDSFIEPDDFPVDDPCIVNLLPASGTLVILQSVAFACALDEPDDEDPDPPIISGNATTPVTFGCGCMDFACWNELEGEGTSSSPCFWIIMILVISIVLATVAATVFYCYERREASVSYQESQKIVRTRYREAARQEQLADQRAGVRVPSG